MWRSGSACASVKCRWTGSTIPTRTFHIVSTATDDLRGVWRMLVRRPKELRPAELRRAGAAEVTSDQLLRFAGVGLVSTLGYLFLFLAWRPVLGAFAANAVAMAIATLFNTAVHKELARGADGHARHARMALVTVLLYMVSLAFTSLGLVVADWIAPSVLLGEVLALTVANLVAAVFRFSVLRAWVFRPGRVLPPTPWRCPDGPHALPRRASRSDRPAQPGDPPRRPEQSRRSGLPWHRDRRRRSHRRRSHRHRSHRTRRCQRIVQRPIPGSTWPPGPRPGRIQRFFRGKESDAAWVRPALLVLIVGTAFLYLWDLGASGWSNSFYAAAVQAGTKSWKAMFFGSSDS